jgi:prepilin signal peptidase PulO-like enzyme (type II secretory pathway)
MIIVILAVLGLCLGSFVNALVYRLHEQEKLASKKPTAKLTKQQEALSIATGRSMCPHCKHELAAKDLVPAVSWLLLKGKCRYCGKPIPDTPIPELVTPALFILSYSVWPFSLHHVAGQGIDAGIAYFALWCAFIVGFVALAIYDLKWFTLPNRIVFPLIGLATFQDLLGATVYHGGLHTIFSAFWGIVIASGIFYVLFQVSDGKWIGGGDVKLGLVLGLLVGGPGKALLLIFTASLLGTVMAVPFLVTGRMKRTSKLPFGPFLLAATIIVVLWGASIIAWYTRMLTGV